MSEEVIASHLCSPDVRPNSMVVAAYSGDKNGQVCTVSIKRMDADIETHSVGIKNGKYTCRSATTGSFTVLQDVVQELILTCGCMMIPKNNGVREDLALLTPSHIIEDMREMLMSIKGAFWGSSTRGCYISNEQRALIADIKKLESTWSHHIPPGVVVCYNDGYRGELCCIITPHETYAVAFSSRSYHLYTLEKFSDSMEDFWSLTELMNYMNT